jgi:hypothetical protein
MPINLPSNYVSTGGGNYNPPIPIPGGVLTLVQQQGFGFVTTLINTFFTSNPYTASNIVGNFIYYGTSVPATSIQNVSDYNNFSFQAFLTGSSAPASGSITISSSIDGLNWIGEFSLIGSQTGSVYKTSGRSYYYLATYNGSGNTTGSLYLVAGQ